METNTYKFFAFISYKRQDEKYAKWLQNKLEHYRLPTTIHKKNKHLKRLKPIFRDNTDLGIGTLSKELKNNLLQSKYLIVICSKLSVKSEYVGAEIEYFISLGREDNVIPFIIDGIPYSDNEQECLHPIIKKYFPHREEINENKEILCANINEESKDRKWIKKEKAVIKVIAKMHELSFDELWQREKRRKIKRFFSLLFLFFIACLLMAFVFKQSQPKDISIYLNEVSYHNNNLPPLKDAEIILYLDNDTRKDTIKSLKDKAFFPNIPVKYIGKKVRLIFETTNKAYKENDYKKVDTFIVLRESQIINIQRNDSTYGYFYLELEDELSNQLLRNTFVSIEGITYKTNEEGILQCLIPLEKQKENYLLKKINSENINIISATYDAIGQFKQIK